ncbi:angiopoietin-2-like [Patiria miniata]|uniref:Fibrinogen C-terminal domain-containing protein n=1 Tax=Patiria miniata TaxID=46514 RepID=A0A914AZ24_PATMI|nr:angiopoietin-2-like [Patiria miniata]
MSPGRLLKSPRIPQNQLPAAPQMPKSRLPRDRHSSYQLLPTRHQFSSIPEPTEPPADCQEILDAGQSTSGVYTILHGDQDMQDMQVYCRMESGKGYIVFQRRLDGSVSFNRTWQEYAEGFGDLTGEFWLGNQKLRSLTGNGEWELVITLRAFDGEEARVRYEKFGLHWYIYWLIVSGFTNEAGDAGT